MGGDGPGPRRSGRGPAASPIRPGPARAATGRRSRRSTPRSSGPRLDASSDRTEDAEVLVVSFGTTAACSSTAWSTSCGPTGCGSARSAPSRCGRSPATRSPRPPQGCSHVLVYELNAGQMVDDVRMHAADRTVDSLHRRRLPGRFRYAPGRPPRRRELRRRVLPAGRRARPRASRSGPRRRPGGAPHDRRHPCGRRAPLARGGRLQAGPPPVLRARAVPGVRAPRRLAVVLEVLDRARALASGGHRSSGTVATRR